MQNLHVNQTKCSRVILVNYEHVFAWRNQIYWRNDVTKTDEPVSFVFHHLTT